MPTYAKQKDAYPIVHLEETDVDLPSNPNSRLRYVYFKQIAKGGKCNIQSCKDLHLRRVICYKTLRPELAKDPAERKRFIREARVTAMLQHPNTIPTYELGRDASGNYYFTMKLVYGATLRELLEGEGEFIYPAHGRALPNLIRIVEQVAHALHYAHQHGVVHRDIKPENVLIGPFSEVLVLDWGMAKVEGESTEESPSAPVQPMSATERKAAGDDLGLTMANPLQGSPPYLSPEQLVLRNTVDLRSDIYSLGAILYEVLTKDRMIPGETVSEVLDYIRNQVVPRPSDRVEGRDVPEVLEQVCLKCVARDPDDRYSSMDQVINELISWQKSTLRGWEAAA
ncbi:MAG: serine/threonine protein kinase [Pseudomonadales bacterium]|nr:serine/threonine protein kinase [Pseudomonadales bacterium]